MSEYDAPGVARAAPLGHDARAAWRGARLLGPQGPVRGRPARRVREGGPADLGPLPAGVRRRAPDRPAGSRRRLPALRDRAHLEHRLRRSPGAGRRVRALRAHVLERRIERAIESSFRPEFRNRLDRIVVFRPFERSAMRALLGKELAEALARRGPRPTVGRRDRRLRVRVPHRQGVQPGARRATAQGRSSATCSRRSPPRSSSSPCPRATSSCS